MDTALSLPMWVALFAAIFGIFKPGPVLRFSVNPTRAKAFFVHTFFYLLYALAVGFYAVSERMISSAAAVILVLIFMAYHAGCFSVRVSEVIKRFAEKNATKNSKKRAKPKDHGITRTGTYSSPSTNPAGVHAVTSFSDPNTEYIVDTDKLTCTCPNFQDRKYRGRKDPERLCKHLVQILGEIGRPEAAATGRTFMTDTVCGSPVELRIKEGSEWADVYYEGERHGYHLERGYWTNHTRDLLKYDELNKWVQSQI